MADSGVDVAELISPSYNLIQWAKQHFCFPDKARSTSGMGRTLAESYPAARLVFETADQALGFSISRLCIEGSEEELKLTENTQPALLTVSIAAFTVLRELGVRPDYVAGHSLGEYSALVAAGSLRFTDALRLVRKRGRFMQEAVPPGQGAMAALLKLPAGQLDEILAESRARRDCHRGEFECARPGSDRRACRRRKPGDGTGESRRARAARCRWR